MDDLIQVFEYEYRVQEEIPATAPKRGDIVKSAPEDFIGRKHVRVALQGVYHHDGYAVASDGYTLIADKTYYEEELEGCLVAVDGTHLADKYPEYEVLRKVDAEHLPVDYKKLSGQLRTIRQTLQKTITGVGKTDKINNSLVVVRLPYGELDNCEVHDGDVVLGYRLRQLEKFSAAAERLGIETISSRSTNTLAEGDNGWAVIGAVETNVETIKYAAALIDLKQ